MPDAVAEDLIYARFKSKAGTCMPCFHSDLLELFESSPESCPQQLSGPAGLALQR